MAGVGQILFELALTLDESKGNRNISMYYL